MAKTNSEEKGGKVRVVVFEMEGSNTTLQESMRTLAAVLSKPSTQLPKASNSSGKLAKELQDGPLADETDETEEAVFEEEKAPTPKREKKPSATKMPPLVEIDFSMGSTDFETFVNLKAPKNNTDKFLVCTYWLKEFAGIIPVTPSHIFTCYRRLKWPLPGNFSQNFIDGVKRQYYSHSGTSQWSLTGIGLNLVDKMGNGK